MTELSYSKSFLAVVARLPTPLSADHVQDPRQLPARSPYTLPRTHPEPKKRSSAAQRASSVSVQITLKPLRPTAGLNPLPLPQTALSTTIATLKAKYAAAVSADPAKLKLLLKGKPLADVKTLAELGIKPHDGGEQGGEEGGEVVITVMLMAGATVGGASAETEMKDADAKVRLLEQDSFWKELGAFLTQKLGAAEVEEDPGKVLAAFRSAWK